MQLRRYFAGLVAFGFVVCWTSMGLVTAVLATGACIAIVNYPALLARRRQARHRPTSRASPGEAALPKGSAVL